MNKICIAVDYSPSARKVAEIGFAHAHMLNAGITLVHVVANSGNYDMGYSSVMGFDGYAVMPNLQVMEALQETSQEYLKKVKNHLGDDSIDLQVLTGGDTSTALLEFATEWGADLLVIGTHSHSALENLFMGNTAASIVKNTKIPLLVIPVNDKDEVDY